MVDLELQDKVAIVTGAGNGIGLATVRALVSEGAFVAGASRGIEHLEGLGRVTAVALDLATPEGPAALIRRVVDEHGRVDVLVNNVGAAQMRLAGFLATTDADFEWVGPVGTDFWLGPSGVAATVAKATGVDADTARERIVAGMGGIPTGRFTTPEEVATLVTLLASDRTSNVTGTNYVIDGGLIKTT